MPANSTCPQPPTDQASYFVTELLGTDLHRLLTSRPLEKQFIQYFLYQILVRGQISILTIWTNSDSVA